MNKTIRLFYKVMETCGYSEIEATRILEELEQRLNAPEDWWFYANQIERKFVDIDYDKQREIDFIRKYYKDNMKRIAQRLGVEVKYAKEIFLGKKKTITRDMSDKIYSLFVKCIERSSLKDER